MFHSGYPAVGPLRVPQGVPASVESAPAPLQLGQASDHAAGDDLEHLFDDALSFVSSAAERELALCGPAARKCSERRARHLQHVPVEREIELRHAESILDAIVSA